MPTILGERRTRDGWPFLCLFHLETDTSHAEDGVNVGAVKAEAASILAYGARIASGIVKVDGASARTGQVTSTVLNGQAGNIGDFGDFRHGKVLGEGVVLGKSKVFGKGNVLGKRKVQVNAGLGSVLQRKANLQGSVVDWFSAKNIFKAEFFRIGTNDIDLTSENVEIAGAVQAIQFFGERQLVKGPRTETTNGTLLLGAQQHTVVFDHVVGTKANGNCQGSDGEEKSTGEHGAVADGA